MTIAENRPEYCCRHTEGGASGGGALIQRVGQRFAAFGRAMNPNVHRDMVVPDGVYTKYVETPRCHEVSVPSSSDMTHPCDGIVARVPCCLVHDGLPIGDSMQRWLDLESRDALGSRGGGSIQHRIAVRPHAGRLAVPGLRRIERFVCTPQSSNDRCTCLRIFVASSLFQGVLRTRIRTYFGWNSIHFVELASNQVVGGSIPSGPTIEIKQLRA